MIRWAPRRAVWTYPDRLRVAFYALILGYDVLYGGTFALGGRAESPTHLLMKHYHISIQIWGAILAVSAIACWCGYAERGAIGCVLMWLFMMCMSLATLFNDTALSQVGPLTFGLLAGVHMVISYGSSSGLARRAPLDDTDRR